MINPTVKRLLKNCLPRLMYDLLVSLKYVGSKKVPNYTGFVHLVAGKDGLEIGGPSTLFKTSLPLYKSIRNLDGVNFSVQTIWEGEIKPGMSYNYMAGRTGRQFIADATDLSEIDDSTYDFVLSSNCLEHVANPMRALTEWKRVLKNQGILVLVLPNKANNFDHKRPTTTFDHILKDFHDHTSEHDLTHLQEILNLHDLAMDPPAGTFEQFRSRSLDNYRNRTLHHHVFDLSLMSSMLAYLGFNIVQKEETPKDLIVLAIKQSQTKLGGN